MIRNCIYMAAIGLLLFIIPTSQAAEFKLVTLQFSTTEAGNAVGADINHDGLPDIVMVNSVFGKGPSIVTLFGKAGGGFGKPITTPAYVLGDFPVFTAADINGDGNLDIVALTFTQGVPYVFLGNGDGTFQHGVKVPYPSIGLSCALGDFNGDGKLDLVGVWSPKNNKNGVQLNVLFGNGDGTFQAPLRTTVSTIAGSATITPGDFNLDGKQDLVITLYEITKTEIAILLGNGDGTFSQSNTTISGSPYDEVVGDMNGDGFPDLVANDQNIGQVYIQLGNGDGTFQTPLTYPVAMGGGGTVALADFNGDGHLDVTVNDGNDVESVFLGNGDGTLAPRIDYKVVQNAFLKQQVVGDFNGDGLIDIVIPNQEGSNGGTISILQNTGTPSAKR